MHCTTVPGSSFGRCSGRLDYRVCLLTLAALSTAFGCGSSAEDETPSGPRPPTFSDDSQTPPGQGTTPAGNGNPGTGLGTGAGPGEGPGNAPIVNNGTGGSSSGTVTTPTATTEPTAGPTPLGPGNAENSGAACNVTAGAYGTANAKLPNPFAMHDGTIVGSLAEWTCRRAEIKKDVEEFEIGVKPEPPQVAATFANNQLRVQVTTNAGSITLTSNVSGTGSCVVIGMNGNSNLVNGCRQVPFNAGQVVQVSQLNSDQPPNDPYYTVYPELWEEAPYGGTPTSNGNRRIGDYSAWSWGISRLIDGLEQVKAQIGIDTSKIAVHGCSYAGKMALFAGALDERVALTIAQESGGGGIPSWRLSEDFNDRTGVDVEKIDNTNWSWFKDSMLNPPRNPELLPHDHHELIAMIAPRAFIALGNPTQSWLSDESGYKSLVAASEVWKAMGASDRFGYDFNTTNAHCNTSQSQIQSVNAFVNRFLLNQNANTSVANPPNAGNFNLDTAAAIDWETPTLQ